MDPPPPARQRSKMSYACEACRLAKVKCQAGTQAGICKRCHEYKRECIFRTTPRTRRSKISIAARQVAQSSPSPSSSSPSSINPQAAGRSQQRQRQQQPPQLPPPPPSQTFSIDFTMPASEYPIPDFDQLRDRHEQHIAELVPAFYSDEESDDCPSSNSTPMEDDDDDDMAMSPKPVSAAPSNASHSSFASPSSSNSNSKSKSKSKSKPLHQHQPTTTTRTTPLSHHLGLKPQFNLDSASRLLSAFRETMLPHCPFVVLDDEQRPSNPDGAGISGPEEVRSLARDRPFLLLAVLAVTSSSGSLQSHSLYDDEFRKVLGLKFVAGGERSVELLLGLLVYCCWYPFYLRPKNRQIFQYLRMAVDIVRDLELDEESADVDDLASQTPEQRAQRLEGFRALLSCFYTTSTYSWGWAKPTPMMKYTPWISRCCDALERHSELEQDHVLVWLVRLQHILDELYQLSRSRRRATDAQGERHRVLIRLGLETQLREVQNGIPDRLVTLPSIQMVSLVNELYLVAGPLMCAPVPRNSSSSSRSNTNPSTSTPEDEAMDPAKLTHIVIPKVRLFLDQVTPWLTSGRASGFSTSEWSRFIVCFILAYRLSFPLPWCPGYDCLAGREKLDLAGILGRMGGGGDGEETGPGAKDASKRAPTATTATAHPPPPGGSRGGQNKNTDSTAAMRVILATLRKQLEKKSKKLLLLAAKQTAVAEAETEEKEAEAGGGNNSSGRGASACPVLNGSLDAYIPLWSGTQQQQQHQQPQQPQPQQSQQQSSHGRQEGSSSSLFSFPSSSSSGPGSYYYYYSTSAVSQPGTGIGTGFGSPHSHSHSQNLGTLPRTSLNKSNNHSDPVDFSSSSLSSSFCGMGQPQPLLQQQQQQQQQQSMMTGLGAQPGFDGGINSRSTSHNNYGSTNPPVVVFHDLWATMTMGWAADDDDDGSGGGGGGVAAGGGGGGGGWGVDEAGAEVVDMMAPMTGARGWWGS
ncbi:hypothetical protein F4778DRAFT_754425 [Xylariomycetidae sp. FL2044]|nr:hypothetical protein F4778DRAFT_754425 [Xylariomycetidae sp. FL2044]